MVETRRGQGSGAHENQRPHDAARPGNRDISLSQSRNSPVALSPVGPESGLDEGSVSAPRPPLGLNRRKQPFPPVHDRPHAWLWKDPRTREGTPDEVAATAARALRRLLAQVERAAAEVEVVVRNARMHEGVGQARDVTLELPDGRVVRAQKHPYHWWAASRDAAIVGRLRDGATGLARLAALLERVYVESAESPVRTSHAGGSYSESSPQGDDEAAGP